MCKEYWGTCVFLNYAFLRIYIYIYIVLGFLGHIVVFSFFKAISIMFSIMAVLIYIPTNSARGFPFIHIFSSIYFLSIFDDDHSDPCEVIPHCMFDLHFSINEQYLASFSVFVGHLYVFFREMAIQVFHPFFD